VALGIPKRSVRELHCFRSYTTEDASAAEAVLIHEEQEEQHHDQWGTFSYIAPWCGSDRFQPGELCDVARKLVANPEAGGKSVLMSKIGDFATILDCASEVDNAMQTAQLLSERH